MTSANESSVGIISTGRRVVSKRLQNAITIGVPLAGTLYAVGSGALPTMTTLGVFALFFLLGAMGVAIGLHRYFSHHSFRAGSALHLALGVLGSWAWQGPIEQWVADHRRHHRFADTPLDPHSPHWIDGEPPQSTLRGLLHAHLTWMVLGDVSDPKRYASDVGRDPVTRACSRAYWPLAASTLLLPGLLGYAWAGPDEALRCVLWAGFVRVWLIQNFTWAIASFGHSFGEKRPDAKDEARNSTTLALLILGEGLHGYHHVHPGVGVNQPASRDLSGWILKTWERLGWISELKRAG